MNQAKSLVIRPADRVAKDGDIAIVVPTTKRTKSRPSEASKEKLALERSMKEAELEFTRAQTNAVYSEQDHANEKRKRELELLDGQIELQIEQKKQIVEETKKTVEETRNLRRWLYAFLVTAVMAMAAVGGVAVQYLKDTNETALKSIEVEKEQTQLQKEELELFKKQNPEISKLYEQIGGLKGEYEALKKKYEAAISKPSGNKPSAPSTNLNHH